MLEYLIQNHKIQKILDVVLKLISDTCKDL